MHSAVPALGHLSYIDLIKMLFLLEIMNLKIWKNLQKVPSTVTKSKLIMKNIREGEKSDWFDGHYIYIKYRDRI